jgi:hypothetical protein
MTSTAEQLEFVPLRKFMLVGVYAVPFPKRVLEISGHRAMQDFAAESSLRLGVPDFRITADDVGDWTVSLSLPDGARCDCFLQQEVLSARAVGITDIDHALRIIEAFVSISFTALGLKYVRQLTLQFENSWAMPDKVPANAILDNRLFGNWDESLFGAFARTVERPLRFASQLHWTLNEGEEAVLSFDIPLSSASTQATTSLGLQYPGAFVFENQPESIGRFLKRGLTAYMEALENVVAPVLTPLDAVSTMEDEK